MVDRYNGIEPDADGVYVKFEDFERLESALESICANSAPHAISLSAENRIKAFYEISCKALGRAPDRGEHN